MAREFRADLHIHTCLSPCAELEMTPRRIVRQAKQETLDIIGICDHNAAENIVAVIRVAEQQEYPLTIIPGIEVTTREEVHLLALFDNLAATLELQSIVYKNLEGRNEPEVFGLQPVVNEDEEVLNFNEHLLIGATSLALERVVELVHSLGGLVVAAHINREAFSIIGQLGMVPEGLELDAVEISAEMKYSEVREKFEASTRYPVIQSSDAHRLEEMGNGMTRFLIEKPTLAEIKKALNRAEGRKITGYQRTNRKA